MSLQAYPHAAVDLGMAVGGGPTLLLRVLQLLPTSSGPEVSESPQKWVKCEAKRFWVTFFGSQKKTTKLSSSWSSSSRLKEEQEVKMRGVRPPVGQCFTHFSAPKKISSWQLLFNNFTHLSWFVATQLNLKSKTPFLRSNSRLEAVLAAKSPKVKGPVKQVDIFNTAAYGTGWIRFWDATDYRHSNRY